MAFNDKEVASTFESIAKGEEGPDTRTDLELYLLDELVANGTDAVVQHRSCDSGHAGCTDNRYVG